jgi:hypothetical protein
LKIIGEDKVSKVKEDRDSMVKEDKEDKEDKEVLMDREDRASTDKEALTDREDRDIMEVSMVVWADRVDLTEVSTPIQMSSPSTTQTTTLIHIQALRLPTSTSVQTFIWPTLSSRKVKNKSQDSLHHMRTSLESQKTQTRDLSIHPSTQQHLTWANTSHQTKLVAKLQTLLRVNALWM